MMISFAVWFDGSGQGGWLVAVSSLLGESLRLHVAHRCDEL